MPDRKMQGSEHWFDPSTGAVVLNESAVSDSAVMSAMHGQHPELASLIRWSIDTKPRDSTLFQRNRYSTPNTVYEQFHAAYLAAQTDDVVSGVLDTTESLAFAKMSFEADDPDEQDVWNQIAARVDLDSRLREMWREIFICSQVVVVTWWGIQTFKIRRTVPRGPARKKTFTRLKVPVGMSILDPLKVVPVGNLLFNQEKLAYIATREEAEQFDKALNGQSQDIAVTQLMMERYEPSLSEKSSLSELNIDTNHLFLLNPKNVWRHTVTRPQYERFAHVRMRSIFELLDLKQHLRQMDRAFLIGGPLRVDQRIATPDGWKPIGAAEVGDKVFSVDGKPTEIIGVYPQGVLPMYRVTFTDGAEVFCDKSHPWTIKTLSGYEKTLTLGQIMEKGLFRKQGKTRRHAYRIPIATPLELEEKNLPLDPYLVGYMIGDGSFTQSMPKVHCAEEDKPWVDVLPLGVTVSHNYETRPGFCPQYGLRGQKWYRGGNPVTEGLRACGLWGMVDEDKFIPDEYLWGSIDQRWSLFQGLCDSDGHSHQAGGVEITTISEKLAAGVVHLAQSLGNVAKIIAREPVGLSRERTIYRVWVSVHQQEAPFRLARKIASWRPRKFPYVRAFHHIERVEDAEAICIKTAREDGLFLTEGMLVTHNTNFLLLVRKGSDEFPARPGELERLSNQVQAAARVPLIVGDHRLQVDIITPDTIHTLHAERHNTLDTRIEARLFQMFMTGRSGGGAKGDDSIKLARVVARGLESRRHMMKRSLEKNLFRQIVEANPQLTTGMPNLRFHPNRVALDFDPAVLTFLQDLRDRGDVSRETALDELGYDQYTEAVKRLREADDYDDIFKTTIPFSTPASPTPSPSAKKAAGRRQGGNKNGGGRNADSDTPNASPTRPRQGNND